MTIQDERDIYKSHLNDEKYRNSIIVDAHKNGWGKTIISLDLFHEREKIVLTSQSKSHLDEILKKLNFNLTEGKDYVFYKPMEEVCSTYLSLWEDDKNGDKLPINEDAKELIHKISVLRHFKKPIDKIHSEDVRCTDPNCPYELQKKKILPIEKGGEGITRIVCSFEMFLTRKFYENVDTIIIDEADGILSKPENEVEEDVFNYIKPYVSNEEYNLSKEDELKMGYLLNFSNLDCYTGINKLYGFPILIPDGKKDEMLDKMQEKIDKLQDKIENNEIPSDEEGKEVEKILYLKTLLEDGFVSAPSVINKNEKEPWHHGDPYKKTEIITRIPSLFVLYNALLKSVLFDKKGKLPQIIITMARIRKNQLMKEDYVHIVWLLIQKAFSENIIYYEKLGKFYPLYFGEDSDLPDEEFTINVIRPNNILMSITQIKKTFETGNRFTPESVDYFLKMHEIIRKIAHKYKNSRGLVITFKPLIDWLGKIKNEFNTHPDEFKNELIKYGVDKDKADKLIEVLKERLYSRFSLKGKEYYPLLHFMMFGNKTAGSEMNKNDKFLIIFGNWYNGENELNPDWEFADKSNHYAIAPRKEIKGMYKEALQNRWARDYLEYPMRSRREKPTYCITHYFREVKDMDKILDKDIAIREKDTAISPLTFSPESELLAITLEILEDYNIKLNFVDPKNL